MKRSARGTESGPAAGPGEPMRSLPGEPTPDGRPSSRQEERRRPGTRLPSKGFSSNRRSKRWEPSPPARLSEEHTQPNSRPRPPSVLHLAPAPSPQQALTEVRPDHEVACWRIEQPVSEKGGFFLPPPPPPPPPPAPSAP